MTKSLFIGAIVVLGLDALAGGCAGDVETPPDTDLTQGSGSITMGETNILPDFDDGNGNLLVAQQAVLSQPATLQSLSFYVTSAAGSLILGVYDATGPGGGPGHRRGQTASFTPVVGWNT